MIEGGNVLKGTVRIQGSKNAALPFMAAALLSSGEMILTDCPKITDVFCMERILNKSGVISWWENHDLHLLAEETGEGRVETKYAGAMRSSVLLLGPLLMKTGKASIGTPGGCTIGKRPIDLHLKLLTKMGAEIWEENGYIEARSRGLHGTEFCFSMRSVGATEQGILSAVCAEGKTILMNCSREPEVVWLCRLLKKMGAVITGEGTECIQIEGQRKLQGTMFHVPADRIVAGTYLCAGAATRGQIVLENAPVDEMQAFLEVYKKIGGQFKQKSGKLCTDSVGVTYPISFLETDVYPGFPTDLQSPFMAVLSTLKGESRIRETIFEDRFHTAGELRKMGVRITAEGRDAVIHAERALSGCEVCARELRGGAALVIAALAAKGTTVLKGYSFIRRGYEDICRDITALGGSIRELQEWE